MDAAAIYPAAYLAIIDVVLDNEGGLSMVATDPGNWTGRAVKLGTLKGTKWGLSAAVFPTLDIANLTRDQAIAIYYPFYYQKASCGSLPPQLALLVMAALSTWPTFGLGWARRLCRLPFRAARLSPLVA